MKPDSKNYISRSSSMSSADRRPLPGTPSTTMIARSSNNRLGAVYAALHSFWMARQAMISNSGGTVARRDAYSVLLYCDLAMPTPIINDFTRTPDQLLQELLPHTASGGTNFVAALRLAQLMMETHWSTERSAQCGRNAVALAYFRPSSPVLIFLSDGECQIPQTQMYDISRRAVTLG
jgi:hypothetical protein